MKNVLVVMAMIASSQVLACPDFSGTWQCTDNQSGEESRVQVTQEGLDITFQNPDETLLIQADEVPRDIEINVYGTPIMGLAYGYCNEENELAYATLIPTEDDAYYYASFFSMEKTSENELSVNYYKNLFPGNYLYVADCKRL